MRNINDEESISMISFIKKLFGRSKWLFSNSVVCGKRLPETDGTFPRNDLWEVETEGEVYKGFVEDNKWTTISDGKHPTINQSEKIRSSIEQYNRSRELCRK